MRHIFRLILARGITLRRYAMNTYDPAACRYSHHDAERSYHFCLQDFDTKDYTLEFHLRSITITQQQFDDGTWQEIVKSALQ
jgi:hypothetical protein